MQPHTTKHPVCGCYWKSQIIFQLQWIIYLLHPPPLAPACGKSCVFGTYLSFSQFFYLPNLKSSPSIHFAVKSNVSNGGLTIVYLTCSAPFNSVLRFYTLRDLERSPLNPLWDIFHYMQINMTSHHELLTNLNTFKHLFWWSLHYQRNYYFKCPAYCSHYYFALC